MKCVQLVTKYGVKHFKATPWFTVIGIGRYIVICIGIRIGVGIGIFVVVCISVGIGIGVYL